MKLITRLTIGAAVAGAMFGLAGTASAAAPVADDVHINYVNGWYPNRETCEASRAITGIWHKTDGCYWKPEGWYYWWW